MIELDLKLIYLSEVYTVKPTLTNIETDNDYLNFYKGNRSCNWSARDASNSLLKFF